MQTEATLASITRFGHELIRTGDLDPVYIGLTGLNLDKEAMAKWLIAYWCFYHAGVTCWMTDLKFDYWGGMETAARNNGPTHWPRAAERRHFRGDKCVKAIEFLARETPTARIDELIRFRAGGGLYDSDILLRITRWPLFGPWIGFKAADMLEACVGYPVVFSDNLGLIYEEPRAALNILASEQYGAGNVWMQLIAAFADTDAPPLKRRKCGVQEIETVCCKWKSHYNGRYTVGKDIKEVRHALHGWGPLADQMLKAMPEEV